MKDRPHGDDHARNGTRLGLGCAALLTALAGLFAMHGLGDHGTPGGQDPHVMAMADQPGPMADLAPVLRLDPAPSTALDMSMVGPCVAVLLVGIVLLLGAVRRGRPVTGRRAVGLIHPARARRTHPPPRPDLFGLSIQRC